MLQNATRRSMLYCPVTQLHSKMFSSPPGPGVEFRLLSRLHLQVDERLDGVSDPLDVDDRPIPGEDSLLLQIADSRSTSPPTGDVLCFA